MAEKVVGYVRVSLKKQVEGYSLEAQEEKIREYATFNQYDLVDIYSDRGESRKDIENRNGFKRMMQEIKSMQDVKYVVVYKLSRFGRSNIDILTSIKELQKYGIELYTIDEKIDTGTQQGKIMVYLLGVMAEIERENILTQTMAGRNTKAENGGWNGGFCPYGYKLVKGMDGSKLEIIESRAKQIQMIFEMFVNKDMGYLPIVQHLNGHGIIRERNENDHNRIYDDWTTDQIKKILDNPVYTGRIAYGRTKNVFDKKLNKYIRVKQEDYILSEPSFPAIISDDLFERAKKKRSEKRGNGMNHIGRLPKHLLSGICKCPDCGKSMVIDTNQWKDKNNIIKKKQYYACKHYQTSGKFGSCRKNSVPAKTVEAEVIQFTKLLLHDKQFAEDIKSRIGATVDVSELEEGMKAISKQMTMVQKQIRNIEYDIDALTEDDRHVKRKRESLNRRLDDFYDKLDYLEDELMRLQTAKDAAKKETLTTETI